MRPTVTYRVASFLQEINDAERQATVDELFTRGARPTCHAIILDALRKVVKDLPKEEAAEVLDAVYHEVMFFADRNSRR